MELTTTNTIKNELIEKGYTIAKNVFSTSDLAPLRDYTFNIIEKWRNDEIISSDFWNYKNSDNEKILYRIHNFERHYPDITKLIDNQKFKALVSSIFGREAYPTVFACIVKIPQKGAGVPWHRDPVDVPSKSVFNFSIFLDKATEENGCLQIAPYSHLDENIEKVNKSEFDQIISLIAEPGDVTIHDVQAYHGSGCSKSPNLRRSIVIEYR